MTYNAYKIIEEELRYVSDYQTAWSTPTVTNNLVGEFGVLYVEQNGQALEQHVKILSSEFGDTADDTKLVLDMGYLLTRVVEKSELKRLYITNDPHSDEFQKALKMARRHWRQVFIGEKNHRDYLAKKKRLDQRAQEILAKLDADDYAFLKENRYIRL